VYKRSVCEPPPADCTSLAAGWQSVVEEALADVEPQPLAAPDVGKKNKAQVRVRLWRPLLS
jgi:hypothetical protein